MGLWLLSVRCKSGVTFIQRSFHDVLLFMALFHVAPQILQRWPRGRQALSRVINNFAQNNGKQNLFSKN